MADPHRFAARKPQKTFLWRMMRKERTRGVEPWQKLRMDFYPGDQVAIVRGEDIGRRGTVCKIDERMNAIHVEGCRLRKEQLLCSPHLPDGLMTYKAHEVPLVHVSLLDPMSGRPCAHRIEETRDPITNEVVRRRFSLESGAEIKIPPKYDIDKAREQEDSSLTTPIHALADVLRVSRGRMWRNEADIVEIMPQRDPRHFAFPASFKHHFLRPLISLKHFCDRIA